jgi:hypothetical protein
MMTWKKTVGLLLLTLTLAFGASCTVGEGEDVSDIEVMEDELRPSGGQFCGGIAGIQCPTGYTCVDDPTDSCDPNAGGADCGGICKKVRCHKTYISHDLNQCALIRYFCADGQHPFSDNNGCGCTTCP